MFPQVQITISRYGGDMSVRTSALRKNARFLIAHTSAKKIDSDRLEKELAELATREKKVVNLKFNAF